MCSWLAGARLVSLLGLLSSCLCLVPVILVHIIGGDHSLLVTPLLISLRVRMCLFNNDWKTNYKVSMYNGIIMDH